MLEIYVAITFNDRVPNDGTWEILAKAGSTRIRVVIEPAAGSDPDKTLKVWMKVRGNRVKSRVADCMDTKMCLKALSGTAGSQLRNDNRKQLACLKGDLSIAQCTAWTTCLDEPGKQVDKAMLLDILEAALPHSALAEFDTESITHTPDEASGDCLHPANDDPESWECECAEALEEHCETSSLSRPDCIRDAMCSSSTIDLFLVPYLINCFTN